MALDTRTAAAKVLGQLLRQQGSLASLMPSFQDKITPQDWGLFQELCFGTARRQPQLQCYLERLLEKPLRGKDSDVLGLLLIGLYQLLFMRIPDHAALNSCVNAASRLKKPWAKGLVNGVLRRFLRERESLDQALAGTPEFDTAHPQWLFDALTAAWPEGAPAIMAANNQHPPFTLRVNQQQSQRQAYCQALEAAGLTALPTPHSPWGVTLTEPVPVNRLPHFAEGAVSVQDEAAQLAANLLDLAPGQRVLDACCAPGGKTGHILETQTDLEQLVALDISEARIQRTAENLLRIGLANRAELVVGDASEPSDWWQGKPFDRILLDAPCSATGIIRRQPDIKLLRQPDQVKKLVALQAKLLSSLWPLLKPGGLLVYATCSILPEENSQQVAEFLAATPSAQHQPITANWGETQHYGQQLFPQANGHDGFYYALLRKVP